MTDLFTFYSEFKSVLGSQIPEDIEEHFTKIWDLLISDKYKNTLEHLLPREGKTKNWYSEIVNSFSDMRRVLGQCFYHFYNLSAIEQIAIKIIKNFNPVSSPNQSIGITCEKMDYEFHSLIFVLKLYLTYLAKFTFSFFKMEDHSFSKYKKSFKGKEIESEQILELVKLLDENWPRLSMYFSIEDRKSVRDMITHFSYVGAGTINIYQLDDNAVAAIAIPEIVIKNEIIKPEFQPEKVNEIGLGTAKLISQQISYLLTFSNEIFKIFNLSDEKDDIS